MTDERVLELLEGILTQKLLGNADEEEAIFIAVQVFRRKGKPTGLAAMGERSFSMLTAVMQGLAARGDTPDEQLFERAKEVVDAAPWAKSS